MKWNGQRITKSVANAIMRGVITGTEAMRLYAIDSIENDPKTGRIYIRDGHAHQASAPGESPASETGELVANIVTEYDYSKLSGTVVAHVPYAAALEYGTEKMEPRPFLRPALLALQDSVRAHIDDEIKIELGRMG